MQNMQARFASQAQAESVIRKLASLRSDCFRLERVGSTDSTGNPMGGSTASGIEAFIDMTVPTGMAVAFPESAVSAASQESSDSTQAAAEYTLSANIPNTVAEQARLVIIQAGGQVL